MKTLLDQILDEFEDAGIYLHEDVESNIYHHETFQTADRDKVREALSKAITKSLLGE